MFIDASAMVALILQETGRDELIDRMAAAPSRQTSVISAFETVLAVGRETGDRKGALDIVRRFLEGAGVIVHDVNAGLLEELAKTYQRHGKGSGHPARLNIGDCFSYAMAKHAGVPLLYKGDDFAQTDLA